MSCARAVKLGELLPCRPLGIGPAAGPTVSVVILLAESTGIKAAASAHGPTRRGCKRAETKRTLEGAMQAKK